MKRLLTTALVIAMTGVFAAELPTFHGTKWEGWEPLENQAEACEASFTAATKGTWGQRWINLRLCRMNRILPEEIETKEWKIPEGVITAETKEEANDQAFWWIIQNEFPYNP